MEKADISTYAKSDGFYLQRIGEFVKSTRIAQHKTQQELAEAAGINRGTLVQLEKGQPVNLLSLIQILRALKQLHFFQQLEPVAQVSPLMLAEAEQKYNLRVRHKTNTAKDKPKSDW
ncbi:helix-turn-helix domain-containing protein [Pedobacter sp. MC2016-14]|uniref:helix-turn-helix domain-containing protein n=1 Tax=Pedobacter sp. MC2016-14 TaxID=2897327 RepID=UPI001E475C26|nr:helix-turn-helix domain-containing protein [Pedobacter sp. MC2016-14]MCD0489776.1 helix-turn-helix domain-containing protein [Pedobacter sp. MC2016-14]